MQAFWRNVVSVFGTKEQNKHAKTKSESLPNLDELKMKEYFYIRSTINELCSTNV